MAPALLKDRGMHRLALSLLLLGAMAPTASAEGTRSLGVTVAPGAYAVTRLERGVATGLSGGIDWDYRSNDAWLSMGGHVASSARFSEATPLRLRIGPPGGRVQPFAGFGLSMLLPWTPPGETAVVAPGLRVGAEVSAGVRMNVTGKVFVASEVRYQNFSLEADPMALARQELVSAYLGLGFGL